MKKLFVTIEIMENGNDDTLFKSEGKIDGIDLRAFIVELDMTKNSLLETLVTDSIIIDKTKSTKKKN